MEDSTPLSHRGEDVSYHAAYKILKNALTPTPSKSTNTGQDSEQKQARADIGKKSLIIAVEDMRRIRQNRLKIAKLDTMLSDESTREGQMEIAKFYFDHQLQRNIKKLDGSMCLLLVQLIQGWSDEEFMAALNSDSNDEKDPSTMSGQSTKGKEKVAGL